MATTYQEWIEHWLKDNRAYGRCQDAARAMAAAFPELTIVPGHVSCDWGYRGHWWLTDTDGNIVDPTASQFGVVFSYHPWQSGDEVRVGKCMNCGDDIWRSVQVLDPPPKSECMCSTECADEFSAYLENDR